MRLPPTAVIYPIVSSRSSFSRALPLGLSSLYYGVSCRTSTKADLEYIYDLLGSYTNGTHNGQVPNPYKYGIGQSHSCRRSLRPVSDTSYARATLTDSRLWSEWSGVERFWGYVWNNSTRLLMPTEGYPDCPDKDDLSLC